MDKKNKPSQRYWSIFLAVAILLVVQISIVSAADWDNRYDYDENTKTATIENWLGLGPDLAYITLTSPHNKIVARGKDVLVGEFNLTTTGDFADVLQALELTNLKNGQTMTRGKQFKIKEWIEDDLFELICENIDWGNGTSYKECHNEEVGKYWKPEWKPISNSNLIFNESQTYQIGVFVDVEKGDRGDWVPQIMGESIVEFAYWTESINVSLYNYYTFNQLGTQPDNATAQHTLTAVSSSPFTLEAGKLEGANRFIRDNDYYVSGDDFGLTGNFDWSYSIWFKIETNASIGSGNRIFDIGLAGGGTRYQCFTENAAGDFDLQCDVSGAQLINYGPIPDKDWHHLVFNYTTTGDLGCGVLDGGTPVCDSGAMNLGTGKLWIGRPINQNDAYFDGLIDDFAIWNRTISASEMSDLWNEGDGIIFGNFAPTLEGLEVTLNSPDNASTFFVQNIDHNVTVTDDFEVANVTLYIDGVLNETNSSGVNGTYIFDKILNYSTHTWYIVAFDNDSNNITSDVRTYTLIEPTDSLTENQFAIYKFDEGSGTSSADSLGIYNLTQGDTPGWNASGINNSAFDATPDELWSSSDSDFLFAYTQPFSINTWVWIDSLSTVNYIVSKAGDNSLNYGRYHLNIESATNQFVYAAHNSSNVQHSIRSTNINATLNEWMMVTTTNDGAGNMSLYVNGAYQGSTTTQDYKDTGEQPMVIGCASDPGAPRYCFDGLIDEVYFFNKSLNTTDVIVLYNSAAGTFWPFSESTPETGLEVTLNSPDNASTFFVQNIDHNVTVTDDFEVANVTLYIDGVLNETNSSGVNGTYIFDKILNYSTHTWYIVAFDNDSNNITSDVRTYTLSEFNSSLNITLNSPDNASTLFTQNIDHNVTVIDDLNVQNVTLYIDGVLNETNSSGFNGTYIFDKILNYSTHTWYIIAVGNDSNEVTSDVRTYTLTEPLNSLTENQFAIYKFDEGSGTSAADSLGIYNLTGRNTPGWNTSGKDNDATDLTPDDNWDNTDSDFLFAWGQPYSVSLWVKPDSFQALNYIISKAADGSTNYQRFGLYVDGANDAYSYVIHDDGGTQYAAVSSTDNATVSEWDHVVITNNGTGNMTLWVNGVYQSSNHVPDYRNTGESPMTIGCASVGTEWCWNGLVDEVYFFNNSLNTSDIFILYDEGAESFYPFVDDPGEFINFSSLSDNSSASYPHKDESVIHKALWASNNSLSSYIFSLDETGSYVNDTSVVMSSTNWTNITKLLTAAKGTNVTWIIYANDSNDNWLGTTEQSYLILNYQTGSSNGSFNPTLVGLNQNSLLSFEMADGDGLADIDMVIASINNGTTTYGGDVNAPTYVKYAGNPIDLSVEMYCPHDSAIHTEFATWYENSVMHSIFRVCQQSAGYIMYSNSTNGINWTDAINVTAPDGHELAFKGFSFPDIKVRDGIKYMTLSNVSGAAGPSTYDVFYYNSSDGINWDIVCSGNTPLIEDTKFNAEILELPDGNWGMLVSTGAGSNWDILYYNSTNVCSGWASQGVTLSQAEGTWTQYINGKWIVYHTDIWANATAWGVGTLSTGETLDALTRLKPSIMHKDQAWEGTNLGGMYGTIIDDYNPTFEYKFYMYYDGDQNITGVGFDSLNRTFEAMHFNETSSGEFYENITLTQRGATNFWEVNFSSAVVGNYTVDYTWMNDTDNTIYTYDYGNISVNVTTTPAGISVTLNSPEDAISSIINEITFNATVTDNFIIQNVTLYIDGVLNETNSSGTSGIYLFPRTLSEGSHNWSILAFDNDSNSDQSATRTLSIDTTPFIEFITPTEDNATSKGSNFIVMGINLTETYFQNITFSLYNSTSLVSGITYTNSTRAYNFTNLADGTYKYNATVWTNTSQSNSTETRFLTISTTPFIGFITPTANNASTKAQSYIIANINLTETNFANLTLELYNGTGLINSTTYTDSTRSINWSGLETGSYEYNATVWTDTTQSNTTETRNITLDTSAPVILVSSPTGIYNFLNNEDSLDLNWSIVGPDAESCWYDYRNFSISSDNLISYYPLDEVSGNPIDFIYNSHANITGSIVQNITGKINNSYNFNTSGYINTNKVYDLYSNGFTISFWANLSNDGVNGILFRDQKDLKGTAIYHLGTILYLSIGDGGASTWGVTNGINSTLRFYSLSLDNDGRILIYIDNVLSRNETNTRGDSSSSLPFCIGSNCGYGGSTPNFNGIIDEISIYERSLTEAERTILYNSGSGARPYNMISYSDLNCSLGTSTINYATGYNELTIYSNDTLGNIASNTTTWANKVTINSVTFNTTSYETARETYTINVTANSSLTAINLLYDGTNYSMTEGASGIWTYSMDLPVSTIGNNTVNFTFAYAGSTFNSEDLHHQNVEHITFVNCNSTYSNDFLRVIFKDEANLSDIGATIPLAEFNYYLGNGDVKKTYEYINVSANNSFSFCASPTDRIFKVDPYVQYKNGITYPQRIWNPTVQNYTSSVTEESLYLLNTLSGHQVTFQVLNSVDQGISSVEATAVREISGEDVTVGSGSTNDAGLISFILNPDFIHTFTFEREGYDTYQTVFAPTETQYTISLGTDTGEQNSSFKGISYSVLPTDSFLENDTNYTFGFTLTSEEYTLDEYGFNLRLKNGTVIVGDTTDVSGTLLTKLYDVNNQSIIYINFWWTIEGNMTSASRYWIVQNTDYGTYSLKTVFLDVDAYIESGLFGLDEFGRKLIVFLIIFIVIGVFSYKYGINSPLGLTAIIFLIIFFFDVVTGIIPTIAIMGKSIENLPTFIMGLILTLLILNEVRTR